MFDISMACVLCSVILFILFSLIRDLIELKVDWGAGFSLTTIKLRRKEFILISPHPTLSIRRGLKNKKYFLKYLNLIAARF